MNRCHQRSRLSRLDVRRKKLAAMSSMLSASQVCQETWDAMSQIGCTSLKIREVITSQPNMASMAASKSRPRWKRDKTGVEVTSGCIASGFNLASGELCTAY